MKSPSVTFKNPPINEVVVSTYFNPPLSDLRSEHIGLFWGKIKQDFPIVSQQPIVGTELDILGNEPFPIPRYWFIAEDKINLIQVQKNAFMFNWRRNDEKYPRFHKNIKPTFDKYYGLFNEFVRTETNIEDLAVDLCELNYINVIDCCEYWEGPQDTPKIIPSFSMLNPNIDDLDFLGFNCNFGYRLSSDLQINIGIRSGFRTQQQDRPVLIFEIKTSGRLGQIEKPEADEWFERAHDAIIKCFLSITDTDIQNRFWQPAEEIQ